MATISLHMPDPEHGRRLPTGKEIVRLIAQLFRHQGREVRQYLRFHGVPPDLHKYTPVMAEKILETGYFQRVYRHGQVAAMKGLEAAKKRKRRKKAAAFTAERHVGFSGGIAVELRKSHDFTPGVPPGTPAQAQPQKRSTVPPGTVGFLLTKEINVDPTSSSTWDVFNPRVIDYIRKMVYDFCDETNDTSTMRLDKAYRQFKLDLAQSLQEGEPQKLLTQRIGEIFDDSDRAMRIAVTEASRAVHVAELETTIDGGAKFKSWLQSSDACPRCQALGDLGEIPINKPFTTAGSKNPRYAVVMTAPLHVH